MAAVEVHGMREFQQALRHAVDNEAPKRIGQANKQIGAQFISNWLHPKPVPAAVGVGAGATVRPSATRREVVLRVGGKHRAGHAPMMQWGKRRGAPVGDRTPPRPYIIRSAKKHRSEIGRAWLEAITVALDPAFASTHVD